MDQAELGILLSGRNGVATSARAERLVWAGCLSSQKEALYQFFLSITWTFICLMKSPSVFRFLCARPWAGCWDMGMTTTRFLPLGAWEEAVLTDNCPMAGAMESKARDALASREGQSNQTELSNGPLLSISCSNDTVPSPSACLGIKNGAVNISVRSQRVSKLPQMGSSLRNFLTYRPVFLKAAEGWMLCSQGGGHGEGQGEQLWISFCSWCLLRRGHS